MSVIDSINQARQQGATDDAILQQIQTQNPGKAAVFQKASSMGAKSTDIINEFVKQNTVVTPQQSYGEKVGQEQLAGAQKIGASISKGAQDIALGSDQQNSPDWGTKIAGVGNVIKGGAESAFGTIAGAAQAVFAPVTPAIQAVVKNVTTDNPNFKDSPVGQLVNYLGPKLDAFAQAHPDAATLTGDILNTALLAIGGGASEGAIKEGVSSALTKEALSGAVKDATTAVKSIPDAIIGGADALRNKVTSIGGSAADKATELQTIKDMITPKPTVAQARLATDQGRLFKGESTFLKEGVDQVATSDQQLKTTMTIQRLIPDAAKMDEPTLVVSLKEKIGQLSDALKPEMQKVPVNKATVKQITNEWEKAKVEQASNAYTPSDVNVSKLQTDFEKRLQSSKSGSMQDLWETRQAYDDSVPANVKNANQMSSESLQAKKDMWLQNRRILSNAINNTENGLGETSRKAFSDMKDMYEGKNGIISKAKIGTTPSGLEKFGKTVPGKLIKKGLQAVGLGTGLHLLP